LNALRRRISRKGHRTRPPDKLNADKFAVSNQNTNNSNNNNNNSMGQQQSVNGNPSDGITSRLSFDPSLPSYYRVSMIQ
jgi:hypothetical protein